MNKSDKIICSVAALFAAVFICALAYPADDKTAMDPGTGEAKVEVTWKVRWKVRTGSLPKGVALTPDQTEAWVTNFGNDRGHNITVFNAETGGIKEQIYLRGRAVELAFSPDGKYAYVSNFDNARVYEIDTSTYKTTRQVRVGVNPKIVTLSPDGDRIYASNWSSDSVSVIDADSMEVLGTIKAGNSPRGSDTDLSGKKLFVANFNGYSMTVIDTEELKPIKTIKMKRYPRHVRTTPDGKYVLVSNMGRGADAVGMVDPEKLEVKKWIKVAKGPKAICVTPDSKIAFTADYFADSVSIIDLDQGKVIAVIPGLGDSPCGMDLAKDGRTLYVTSWYSNQLWCIDLEYPRKGPPTSKPKEKEPLEKIAPPKPEPVKKPK
jgi:YVTN family beta-propeller protein